MTEPDVIPLRIIHQGYFSITFRVDFGQWVDIIGGLWFPTEKRGRTLFGAARAAKRVARG